MQHFGRIISLRGLAAGARASTHPCTHGAETWVVPGFSGDPCGAHLYPSWVLLLWHSEHRRLELQGPAALARLHTMSFQFTLPWQLTICQK